MKTKKRLWLSLICALCILAVLPLQTFAAAKAAIKLNVSKTTITVGKSQTLTATVTGKKKKVTWKSSNSKIASVKNGVVTAKKAGKCTITAKANGKTVKCVVTVEKKADYRTRYKEYLSKSKVKAGSKTIKPKYFTILNIDQKGAPELVITESYHTYHVYTFKNNKVIYTGAAAADWNGGPVMYIDYCPKYKSIEISEASLKKGSPGYALFRLNKAGKKLSMKEHATFKYMTDPPFYIGKTASEYKKVSKEELITFFDKYSGCSSREHEHYEFYENTKSNRKNVIK